MAAIIPIALSNGKVGLGSSTFSNGIMFYESGVLGTVLVFSLSLLFSDYFVFRFVNYIGRYSLYFMCMHCLYRKIIYMIFDGLHIATVDQTANQMGYSIICFALIFALSYATVLMINLLKRTMKDRNKNNKKGC